MKIRPSLIIGVGTSGLRVVENLQKFVYEALGVNTLPIYKYIYIETDQEEYPEGTPLGNDIIPVKITVSSISDTMQKLENPEWCPENLPSILGSISAGAGGVRPGGRLALWEPTNMRKVYNTMLSAWLDLKSSDLKTQTKTILDNISTEKGIGKPSEGWIADEYLIYVIGTFTGGSCSGMFIDLGYMLRHISALGDEGAIYGIYFIPTATQVGAEPFFANSFGAFTEFDYFKEGKIYDDDKSWNLGGIELNEKDREKPPFNRVYIASPECGDPSLGGELSKINNKDPDSPLYRMTALKLCSLLLGLADPRSAVAKDGFNAGFGVYGTFGISAILYPKYSISEAVSCELGSALCSRWMNEKNTRFDGYFYIGQDKRDISPGEVQSQALEWWQDVLEAAWPNLRSGVNISRVMKSYFDGDMNEDELEVDFRGGREGTLYSKIFYNKAKFADAISKEFDEKFKDILWETQSLFYIKTFFNTIRSAISNIVEIYDRENVPKDSGAWNAWVNQYIDRIVKDKKDFLSYRTIHERVNMVRADMEDLCKGLEIFMAREELSNRIEQKVNDLLHKVQEIEEKVSRSKEFLEERRIKINSWVKARLPICPVWNSGSYENDVKTILDGSLIPGAQDINILDKVAFYDFLSEKKIKEIFLDIKNEIQKQKIKDLPKVDISEKVDSETAKEYADIATSGFLRLRGDAHIVSGSLPQVPRFIAGRGNLDKILKDIDHYDKDISAGMDVIELPFLDMILFYEEKGIPRIEDIESFRIMQRDFNTPPKNFTKGEKIWKSLRLAYGLHIKKERKELKAAMEFINDVFVKWEEQPAKSGKWIAKEMFPEVDLLSFTISNGEIFLNLEVPRIGIRALKIDSSDDTSIQNAREFSGAFTNLFHEQMKNIGKEKLESFINQNIFPTLQKRYGAEEANKKMDKYKVVIDKITKKGR